MWANTTLSSIFRPITTTTTTVTHRSNHRPATVSAKHPRHQKNIKYDYQEEETTEIDKELELLKQREDGESEDINAYASNSDKIISGSAVLLAMQKASAQKTSKKMNKKKMKKEKMKDVNGDKDKDKDEVEDYSDVKPLCIKSDWKERLDDLEMQLHQLIHHA